MTYVPNVKFGFIIIIIIIIQHVPQRERHTSPL
jgi:hypothetical protein